MQSPGIEVTSPGIEKAFRSIERILRKHLNLFPKAFKAVPGVEKGQTYKVLKNQQQNLNNQQKQK